MCSLTVAGGKKKERCTKISLINFFLSCWRVWWNLEGRRFAWEHVLFAFKSVKLAYKGRVPGRRGTLRWDVHCGTRPRTLIPNMFAISAKRIWERSRGPFSGWCLKGELPQRYGRRQERSRGFASWTRRLFSAIGPRWGTAVARPFTVCCGMKFLSRNHANHESSVECDSCFWHWRRYSRLDSRVKMQTVKWCSNRTNDVTFAEQHLYHCTLSPCCTSLAPAW